MLGATLALPILGLHAVKAASTIRFSYQRSSTLLTLLKAGGTLEALLKPKGFDVSWHLFDNVVVPMNAGAVDFHADVADAVPIFTQSANAPLTFYAKEDASPSAEAIIVKAGSPVRTVADLKGKTVAVHRGSGCHFILASALKRAGLSFRDITPAYLAPPDAAAAFERDSVDACVIWDPFLAITESKLATRTLADATGLSSYDRYYTVNTAFVSTHPEIVGLVFDALVEQGAWVKKNPQDAVAKLAPLWGGIPAATIEVVNRRRSYVVKPVDKAGLGEQQAIADTFFEAGLIPKAIDATAVPLWHPEAHT
ncbi:aliphatic sulfonate ABC transporter substrate-binding protein [Beijerinckia sp. L45]|uniref:aliphatic sulfonate ABC transporter substrate-binding protein n=1 Tax=Beijerinckia sp. L45 TaxID=1641855 RepID=UPI00131A82DE|nr:aliphatic sulfonate ABC transporter substrate-binding protein [Beijerinckia sp. L45]